MKTKGTASKFMKLYVWSVDVPIRLSADPDYCDQYVVTDFFTAYGLFTASAI